MSLGQRIAASPQWGRLVAMGVGIAVGSGVMRQPGWGSRVAQLFTGALVAGFAVLVALVLLALLRTPSR